MNSLMARALGACLILVLVPLAARAQGATGIVVGTVTDGNTDAPLAGASVVVESTGQSAATDRAGRFRLVSVPSGAQRLLVTYLGHGAAQLDVTVVAGQTLAADAALTRTNFAELVQVTSAPIGEGQAQALNQQRTAANITSIVSADQIGSFPDPNAAEAASRIPGVAITRDQGEGRYILVRGTEARLNAVMIDGERIPSPEDTRQIMLDVVPADQLQSIELSKAVTPDMDADSIGGAVNLITKQAVGRPTALFSVGGGYQALQGSYDQRQFSATLGRRFSNGRIGVLFAGSGSQLTRGSENFEAEYDDGNLADLQLRDYQIDRDRYGLNVSVDGRAGNNALFAVRTLFNEFRDYEVNNRERFRPSNRRIEHVLKNRHQSDHVRSVSGSGQHLFAAGAAIDYRVAWAQSREEQPDRLDTIFRQSGITFSPNVSAASIDPDNIQPNPSSDNPAVATLNAWETETFESSDRDVTAAFNVRTPVHQGSRMTTFVKAGAKLKDKAKTNDFLVTTASPASPVPFPALQDAGFDNGRFLSFLAAYPTFPGIDAAASRAMFNALPASQIDVDHESDAQNYDATERVVAGYAMAELYVGERLMLLPGVRYESTKVDYQGFRVLYDDGGDYQATVPTGGDDTHGLLLPGLHLRYSLTPASNLRFAYTRTLGRPNYYDLVPYELVFEEDGEISRGNSALKPTTSQNVDVMAEHYFQSVGVVSAGFFYKRLSDYIFAFRTREAAFGDVYEVTQPRNGDSASLYGVELALQNQLRFLPAPFDGLGIYANVTLTDSSARVPDRDPDATLPGQSSRIGNLALWYERAGFSARSSWNFHGRYIDAVGQSVDEDVYYDTHVQWDLSFSQRVHRTARLYADFLNLTNAPLRYYIGSVNRPIQEEYYRWWASFGVRVHF